MSTFTPKVRLWPGMSLTQDASTWGLGVDITPWVRRPGQDGGQAISYSAGRQDEGNQIDAGTLDVTLDNRTGIWSPGNVTGPYYGKLKRNTPIQLTTTTGYDSFGRVLATGQLGTSTSGQNWTSSSSWTVTGTEAYSSLAVNAAIIATLDNADSWNFDLRYTCWVDQVATGANLIMGGIARTVDASNFLLARCEFNTAGTVDARVGRRTTAGGIATISAAAGVFSYTANTKVRVRFQGDGPAVRMKIWKPANPALPDADEPATWTVTGADTDIGGTKLGLFPWRVGGNTNTNPKIYVDDFTADAEEWTGGVAQWPTRWNMTGANAWAPIQAGGVLRRLRQGQGQLQSALRRQLAAYSPTGFWPLEDGPGSTSFASAITGLQPATFSMVTPGTDNSLAGAALSPTFDDPFSSITANTPRSPSPNTGFAVMWLMKMQSLPASNTLVARIKVNGRYSKWEIAMTPTGTVVRAYEGDETTPGVDSSALYGTNVNPLGWFACQLEVANSGGINTWAFITHQVGDNTYYSQSSSYLSGAVPTCSSVRLGGSQLDGCAFSMLWIGPDTLPFVADSFSLVSSGYAGEKAAVRAARVATEARVPLIIEPGDSEAMGAQKEATALEALRSCEITDYGILYETGSGLGFRPRVARYNPSTFLTLSLVAGHLALPPEPTYDDQKLRNVWTVTRIGGSSATVVDDTSVALEGEIAGSDTVNTQTDDVLPNHAGWRTYLGVQDQLRWPSITLDFARNPGLLAYWRARRYGFRFKVATGLPQVAGAEPDVIAEGYQATLHPDGWQVTLNCSGAAPWDVSVLESATSPVRLDTAGTQLTSGVNSTATSWPVTVTTGPIWNTAATFPILMMCEGELISVSAISGAGPGQTFTVTRSVNGVVKSHLAAAPVSLAYPSRAAL